MFSAGSQSLSQAALRALRWIPNQHSDAIRVARDVGFGRSGAPSLFRPCLLTFAANLEQVLRVDIVVFLLQTCVPHISIPLRFSTQSNLSRNNSERFCPA